MDSLQQNQIRNEVEVFGIPEGETENVHHLATVMAAKMGVELNQEDVDEIYRVGAKKADSKLSRPIVIRLTRRAKKQELINAAKSRKKMTSEGITTGPKDTVFINERLTQKGRFLFRDTRTRASLHGFKYCWTKGGNIYVRKVEKTPAIRIKTQADLDDKIGPNIQIPLADDIATV